ncbi:MAG: ribose 5-phosphate isomerase B [Flavobacteriales bacterium]|nr:ribose 5-phosphate isomerase B [Flavobacteriales bacterium]
MNNPEKTIAIGSDHAGFSLKSILVEYLRKNHFEVFDVGPASEDRVDYPDFAHPVASAIESGKAHFGVLLCGSGNGIAMTANKHSGIRAAVCWNREIAALARQHNDANILAIPARYVTENEALEMLDVFIGTSFEGGRHTQRVQKIPL